jgi:hypothetical protein
MNDKSLEYFEFGVLKVWETQLSTLGTLSILGTPDIPDTLGTLSILGTSVT